MYALKNSSDALTWSNPSFILDNTTTELRRQQTDESHVTATSGITVAPFLPWDNPDNLMTFEQYDITAKVTTFVLSPLLLLIGTPANLICCLVFYKQGLRDRMNLCLFVLALADAVLLVSSCIMCSNSFVALWDEKRARKYLAEVLVYVGWIVFGSRGISGSITMLVAVERCLCVLYPLKANTLMRTRTMGAILATICILCTLASSIAFFRNRVVSIYDPASGEIHYILAVTDFFVTHHLIFDIVYDIILNFSLPIVNLVVVGVATAITVIKLRMAMAWRASTSSGSADNHSQQHQAALSKMLVILSCVFMACSAPLTSMSVVRLFVPDYALDGRYSNFFYASHTVAIHFITPVNSAVNFFVYYARSSRFRQELRATLPPFCKVKGGSKGDPKLDPSTTFREY